VNRAAAVVAGIAAAIATEAGACHRGDEEIRKEFTAAFDAPPVLAIEPCWDGGERMPRLQQLLDLAMRAYKKAGAFEDPLPADLQTELMATPIEGMVSDYLCFVADGTDRKLLMGTIANLYLHKGEALLAQGQIDDGWTHVVQGLKVYSAPRPFEFLMYFGAGGVVRRIRTIVPRHPPSARDLDRLEMMAASAPLRRSDFCAGLKLEFLSQAYLPFIEVLAPTLRPRVTARWGARADAAFASMAQNSQRGNLALWRATADLYGPLVAGCLDPKAPPLARLETAARAKLAGLPRESSVAQLAPTTLDRLRQYADLEDQFLLFFVDMGRRRLQIAGVPTNAASVEKRILVPSLPVPLISAWDGSRVAVQDDPSAPAALIVTRGQMREVLAPLPALPRR
jgi:hypothetical protein